MLKDSLSLFEDESGSLPGRTDPAITRFPSPIAFSNLSLSPEEKIDYIAKRFAEIMEALGLDLEDESLSMTPRRIAKMYVEEVFTGLDYESFPEISFIPDPNLSGKNSNLVFVKVAFTSFCEHHFVPMRGKAYIGYLPHKKLIGLSNIPKIVRYFAKRPQVQERLTAQIADCLALLLETEHVAVSLSAEHYCVIARGIEDAEGRMITNSLRGVFETEGAYRQEFFEGINRTS